MGLLVREHRVHGPARAYALAGSGSAELLESTGGGVSVDKDAELGATRDCELAGFAAETAYGLDEAIAIRVRRRYLRRYGKARRINDGKLDEPLARLGREVHAAGVAQSISLNRGRGAEYVPDALRVLTFFLPASAVGAKRAPSTRAPANTMVNDFRIVRLLRRSRSVTWWIGHRPLISCDETVLTASKKGTIRTVVPCGVNYAGIGSLQENPAT